MGNLSLLFRPESIAVIGASHVKGKIGNSVVVNLLKSGYRGAIYPINPKVGDIEGLKCYPDVLDLPAGPDVAVVCVPFGAVLELARRCGQAGVKFLVVITAGFKELGFEGLQRERELLKVCQEYGMRLVGPNCLGIIDTHTPLNATFGGPIPFSGNIAFISQSGALGVSVLDWARDRKIGLSRFVSLGNKADLNEVDFLEDIADDPNTRVVLCYLEDVADGERFVRVVQAVTDKLPVIIFKSGITEAGARAASSHTGALAGSDKAYDTAFKQYGVLRARSMEELFNLAFAFAMQPLPKGKNVAVITNAGGPGIITTDSIESVGLNVARFQRSTLERLKANLPIECNIYNPVDLLGGATEGRYEFALDAVLQDENVDSAIVLLTPQSGVRPELTAHAVARVAARYPEKPVVASFMGGGAVRSANEHLSASGIPSYQFPEPAVAALAGLTQYGLMRRRRKSELQEKVLRPANARPEQVQKTIDGARAEGRVVLLGSEAALLASAYAIPAAPTELARTPREVVEIAERLGYPVVLKIASPKVVHKTDVGGVKVNLRDAESVSAGFAAIVESVNRFLPGAAIHGVTVQKMMPQGLEVIVGMTRDVQFGPLLAFGLGGVYVNLIKDAAFRLARDLTRADIREMIQETRAYTILKGFRGSPRLDVSAVEDVIASVASLALDFPEIAELEINPLFVYEQGVSALDVKVTIQARQA